PCIELAGLFGGQPQGDECGLPRARAPHLVSFNKSLLSHGHLFNITAASPTRAGGPTARLVLARSVLTTNDMRHRQWLHQSLTRLRLRPTICIGLPRHGSTKD